MMTDRIYGLTVALEEDMRFDDATILSDAIRQLRGVLGVVMLVSDHALWTAQERARLEIKRKVYKALEDYSVFDKE